MSEEQEDYTVEGTESERSDLVEVTCPNGWRSLLCVEYPGVVENEERAIQTFGGVDALSKACYEGHSRLEVRYRSDDLFCKPTVGRMKKASDLVLKIKRRRVKEIIDEVEETVWEYTAELVGIIETRFEFTGMADFQVLPPGLSKVTHNNVMLDPMALQLSALLENSSIVQDVPSFLPPGSFLRSDKPSNYSYKPDVKPNVTSRNKAVPIMPGSSRLRRAANSVGIPFNHEGPVPNEPIPSASLTKHPKLAPLKKLFAERPVWTRTALQAKLNVSSATMRHLLSLVSYYFTNGPWRLLWIRFGYDPRADPSGKIYQCIDFRVPKNITVVTPSSNYQTRLKRQLGQDTQARRIRTTEETLENDILDAGIDDVSVHTFNPDQLPHQRQLFYQLCDLKSDQLQHIIHANRGKETICNETSGWCEEDTYDKLRKCLTDIIKNTAETASSKEETPT